MRSRPRGQIRVLAEAFLARFFDHDITGGADDLKLSFIWLLAFLAMPGVVMPILQAWAVSWNGHGVDAGWILTASRHGVDALRVSARADKALYLGYAAVSSAAVAALSWNSLLLDRRDTLVLGALPVRPARIIIAKLAALAVYVGAITLAMNALASVMFGTLLATGNSIAFALRGIAAHAVASCGIGAFVVLAMSAVQGILLVIAGPRRFLRVSSTLQAVLAVVIALSLFALPVISSSVNDTLQGTAHARPWLFYTPVLWFLGVYEYLLGGIVDPLLVQLARTAGLALLAAGVVIVVTFPLAYRRLIRVGLDATPRRDLFGMRRVAAALPIIIALRSSERRAIAQFLVTTLVRVERHRFVLATACGLAGAWALPAWLALGTAAPALPSRALYALPFSTLLFLLVGLRVALSLPSDLSGGWIFDIAPPSLAGTRVAVRRTVLALGGVPVIAASAALDAYLWGGAFALRHALISVPTALLLAEILLWNVGEMPCTSPWRPEGANLRARWPVYLLAFAIFTQAIPAMGLVTSRAVPPTLLLSFVLSAIAAAVRAMADRRFAPPRTPTPVEPDLHPVSLRERIAELVSELPHWPAHAWHDVPFALRRLRAAPLFSLFAIITLALGIGATAASYSVMRSLSTARLGFADTDRVMAILRFDDRRARPANLSWLDYQDLAAAETVFSGVSAWTSLPSSVAANGVADLVAIEGVSGGGFDVVGVRPVIGRAIARDDDRPDAPPVAVLSDALWRSRFSASPTVLGTPIRVGGRVFTVIGVAPPAFQGVEQQNLLRTSLWIPLAHAPAMFQTIGFRLDLTNRRHEWLRFLGRLNASSTTTQAATEVNSIGRRLDIGAPIVGSTRSEAARRWTTRPAAEAINSQGSTVLALMLYVSLPALVLLVACSNLANLVLSRGASRQHDLAVRQALGASRSRLVREQVIDSMFLAALGSLGGIVVARGLLVAIAGMVRRTFGALPQYQIDASLSSALIGPAMAAAVATVLVAGLAPALPLTRGAFRRAFAGAAGSAVPRWQGRARVITAQVAISAGLLLVASLFVRQLVVDLGRPGRAELDRVGVVMLPLGAQQRDETSGRRAIERVVFGAHQSAGLASVAAVSLTGRDLTTPLAVEVSLPGRPLPTEGRRRFSDLIIGSPSVFAVLGLPVRFGRAFDERDTAGAEAVAVIGARLSRALFGVDDSTGRQLQIKGSGRTPAGADTIRALRIIGVADDWNAGNDTAEVTTVYVPFAQDYASDMAIVARARSSNGATATALIRQVVHDADPDLAIGFSGTADVAANQRSRLYGLITSIAASLAMLAVTLAMAGLYGVLVHVVGRRTREIGVRVALGAGTRDIVTMIMREGLRPVGLGLVLGIGTATLLRLALQPFFSRSIAPIDGLTLLLATLPLAIAAALACYVPARRAARVSPTEALRHT